MEHIATNKVKKTQQVTLHVSEYRDLISFCVII